MAGGDLNLAGVTAGPFRQPAQTWRPFLQQLKAGAGRVPGIAELGRPPDGPTAAAADPERRMGALHRLGERVDPGETKVLSLKIRPVHRPDVLEHLKHLVGDGSPFLPGSAQRPVFLLPRTDAYSQDKPAVGELVYGGGDLGHMQRVSEGEDNYAGSQSDVLCNRRHVPQHGKGVVIA